MRSTFARRVSICEDEPQRTESLAGTDFGHVVVLAEAGEVFVELLDSLFVRLDAFFLQAFVELERGQFEGAV